eukprot:gene12347-12481_t
MGIETTAVYDPTTREFVLHTPSNTASKYWIGGAGQHAKLCAMFEQLMTADGACKGPHVFLVRLRDDRCQTTPGEAGLWHQASQSKLAGHVRDACCIICHIHRCVYQDLGPKMGLNGVDNGQIWLDHVRVPHDALLDRFASVDAATGCYSGPIANNTARFGTMVGALTLGLVLLAQQTAVEACKIGLTIAICYAAQRPQFGDKLILNYLTLQRRLLPGLAATSSPALQLYIKHLTLLIDF